MSDEGNVWTTPEPKVPPTIKVGDREFKVELESDFVSTILGIVRSLGIGRFLVKYNGSVITPAEAPDTFEDYAGKTIVIEPVDEAG